MAARRIGIPGNNFVHIADMFMVQYVVHIRIDAAQQVMDPLLKKAQRRQGVNRIGIFAGFINEGMYPAVNAVKSSSVTTAGRRGKIGIHPRQPLLKVLGNHPAGPLDDNDFQRGSNLRLEEIVINTDLANLNTQTRDGLNDGIKFQKP